MTNRLIQQFLEAAYSTKAGSEGKDLGKKGKNFSKIASSAGKEYGSKAAGERVAGAILAKIRAKHMHEDAVPTNNVGTGNIAGANKDPPGGSTAKLIRRLKAPSQLVEK